MKAEHAVSEPLRKEPASRRTPEGTSGERSRQGVTPRPLGRSHRRDVLSIGLGESREERSRLYADLARALLAVSGRAGAVFEQRSVDRVPRLMVRPASIASLLPDAVDGGGAHSGRATPPPTLAPPAGMRERFGVLRVPPGTRSSGITGAASACEPLGDLPDAWLGVQTYWIPRPLGGLWLARRFRLAVRDPRDLDRRFEAVGLALARQWSECLGVRCAAHPLGRHRLAREWRRLSVRTVPREGWFAQPLERAASTGELPAPPRPAASLSW
ncbi:MAG: hypothetical protein ACREEC_09005, partial [Thermoplasmata archaeon]